MVTPFVGTKAPALVLKGVDRLAVAGVDAEGDGTGGTTGGARSSVSRVTSCPEGFLMATFVGREVPASVLREVDRSEIAGVDGGGVTEGGDLGTDRCGGWRIVGGMACN
jgi:hypothetical protein